MFLLIDSNGMTTCMGIFPSLVKFYGISTVVGYLMPNPVYTYILDIYDFKT